MRKKSKTIESLNSLIILIMAVVKFLRKCCSELLSYVPGSLVKLGINWDVFSAVLILLKIKNKFEHIIDFVNCNVGTGSGPPVVAVACM